jgi:hypothetical protein
MKYNLTPVSSSLFSWNGLKATTEDSTLYGVNTRVPLYDDACDVGFAIKSEKTGRVSTWFFSEELRDGEEVVGWLYKPTTESVRKNQGLSGYTLTIFND